MRCARPTRRESDHAGEPSTSTRSTSSTRPDSPSNGYPHDVWARLRAEAPVAYIEPPGHPPFWAVTKHADIMKVASQPQLFSSAEGITLDMDLSGLDQSCRR